VLKAVGRNADPEDVTLYVAEDTEVRKAYEVTSQLTKYVFAGSERLAKLVDGDGTHHVLPGYLAAVIDLFSRRVVGWAVAEHMHTELVLEALQRAITLRRPAAGLVHHSDRGSQYASAAYRAVLAKHGIVQSMSRQGDCWDNAVVESFFATLKEECIYRRSWPTRSHVYTGIAEYIEQFYNCHRRHSTLDHVSPVEYELATRMVEKAA
jgi:putative transposase